MGPHVAECLRLLFFGVLSHKIALQIHVDLKKAKLSFLSTNILRKSGVNIMAPERCSVYKACTVN